MTFNIDPSPFNLSRLSIPNSSVTLAAGEESTTFTVDTVPNDSQDGDIVFTLTATESLSGGGPGGPGGPGGSTAEASFQEGSTVIILKDDNIPAPTLVINEALVRSEGGPGPEFIEIFNGGDLGAVNLSGYKVVFYDADPDGTFGTIQEEITITSGSVNPGEFFLIGSPTVSSLYGIDPDLELPNSSFPDGDTTIVLFDNTPDQPRPVYSALLQDGELDAIPNTDGTPLAADILVGQEGQSSPAGYFLTTDGGQASQILELVGPTTVAISASPGRPNSNSPTLFLSRSQELIEEDDTEAIEFTVTRVPDISGDLVVNIQNFDDSELTLPSSVTIPAGEFSATFFASPTAERDLIRDGLQDVIIEVTAADHISDSVNVTVLDSDIPALNVADIGFVAAVSDSSNIFAFVTVVDIANSTRITFTDNGWRSNGSFETEEGQITWLATTDIPAGTVVTFTDNEPDVGSVSAGMVNLSDSGDQIFAFQGTLENPTLIAGIQMNGAFDFDATDVFTSALPAALANVGSVAIDPERNNAVYTGPTTVVLAETLRELLADPNNFTSGNSNAAVGPQLIPASFTLGVIYAVTLEEISVNANSVTLDFTANGLSDIYRTGDLVDWSLAPGGSEVESGSYTDPSPLDERAFYSIQEAGTPAP